MATTDRSKSGPDGAPAGTELATRLPAPGLRHAVRRYVGYRQEDLPTGTHRGLPSRSLTLIISLAGPIRLAALPDPAQAPREFGTCVGGLHTSPAVIAQDGQNSGIHVELDPLGAPDLLGLPAGELASTVIELADLPGRWMRGLADRLVTTPGWEGRFDILDRVFATAGTQRREPGPEVGWAWRRLLDAGGRLPIDRLAGEVGWSRRHLGERFRREFGVSPKQAARIIRFERSRALLQRSVRMNLADVATVSGFHDQAHMTNEWQALAGCTPGTWIATELPFLQYDDEEQAALWPA